MINRITFVLALLGIVLTTHMWIQKQRGFDYGCLGAQGSQVESATVSGCEEAMTSENSDFLGVDNILAGFLFYITMSLLSFAALISSQKISALISKAQIGLSAIALLFSLFLVYILFFKLKTTCSLCLTSASLITLMFGSQVYAVRKVTLFEKSDNDSIHDISLFSFSAFVAALLLLGDLLFVSNIFAPQSAGDDVKAAVNQVLEERFDSHYLNMMAPCQIDESRAPKTDWRQFIEKGDPVLGNPNASVIVIDIFDPNCPHCKKVHEMMKAVVQHYRNRVAFFYKPYPLRPASFDQIRVMWLAKEQKRFFEMVEAQFQMQKKGGLSHEELLQISKRLRLDVKQIEDGLNSSSYDKEIKDFKKKLNAAGIHSAPIILINGKHVGKKRQSLTPQCIGVLLEDELTASGG